MGLFKDYWASRSDVTTLDDADTVVFHRAADGEMVEITKANLTTQVGGAGSGSTTLEGLTDVTITSPISGQSLTWNGSEWANSTVSGGGGTVDSVNTQVGDVVLDADDISDASTTNKFATAAELSKLAGIEAGAEVNAPIVVSYSSEPAGTYLERFDLDYTLATDSPDVRQVLTGGTIRSWMNEWGALRGSSPYTWGDSLIRAILASGNTVTTGNAFELQDRDTVGNPILWGRQWTTGNLVRNDVIMSDCYVCSSSDSDATIEALGLPDNTIVIEVT